MPKVMLIGKTKFTESLQQQLASASSIDWTFTKANNQNELIVSSAFNDTDLFVLSLDLRNMGPSKAMFQLRWLSKLTVSKLSQDAKPEAKFLVFVLPCNGKAEKTPKKKAQKNQLGEKRVQGVEQGFSTGILANSEIISTLKQQDRFIKTSEDRFTHVIQNQDELFDLLKRVLPEQVESEDLKQLEEPPVLARLVTVEELDKETQETPDIEIMREDDDDDNDKESKTYHRQKETIEMASIPDHNNEIAAILVELVGQVAANSEEKKPEDVKTNTAEANQQPLELLTVEPVQDSVITIVEATDSSAVATAEAVASKVVGSAIIHEISLTEAEALKSEVSKANDAWWWWPYVPYAVGGAGGLILMAVITSGDGAASAVGLILGLIFGFAYHYWKAEHEKPEDERTACCFG